MVTYDVVCLGESMITLVPARPGPLADVAVFHRGIGGAESNVACALARLGHRTRWISRVGADGFGEHLLAAIGAAGVDVQAVRRDDTRPTGVYFKERLADRTAVLYYRSGSAAAAMSPGNIDREAVRSGRLLHLSGVTAALSPQCHALLTELTQPWPGRPRVCFDVNFRPALWRSRDPAALAELARGCDIVFVGEDEARAAWGLPDATAIRAALPEPAVLVVKSGADGAVAFHDGTSTRAAAARVDVVDPVGAGDAFAAGFLSGTLRGLPVRERLRHGHLLAAAALTVAGDVGTPPTRRRADALVRLSDEAWGRLRFRPGWTAEAAEVATP